jgi:HPt (histidine-containing phosphotransfer) domain-containing protein
MCLINLDAFKDHYGDDLDILEDLIELFESTYPETVSGIENAVAENNTKNLELHAHTLKGMVANFFCDDIRTKCFELEKMGKEGAMNEPLAILKDIQTQILSMLEELKKL